MISKITIIVKSSTWALPLVVVTLLAVVGCANHNTTKPVTESSRSKFGYNGINNDAAFATAESLSLTTNTVSSQDATAGASASNTPSPNPFLSPTPQPVAAARDIPYGTPVPGKPGFVTSPHSASAGYVDVRGFPPGMEVKDPYSGKVFLVP